MQSQQVELLVSDDVKVIEKVWVEQREVFVSPGPVGNVGGDLIHTLLDRLVVRGARVVGVLRKDRSASDEFISLPAHPSHCFRDSEAALSF
ncbi:MAG: hypothetical protein HKN37_11150 [Rhodothermales bacterium]|nr:hypothetical protein [Rhodothermales bacterium]